MTIVPRRSPILRLRVALLLGLLTLPLLALALPLPPPASAAGSGTPPPPTVRWSSPVDVETGPDAVADPDIAAGPDGTATILYLRGLRSQTLARLDPRSGVVAGPVVVADGAVPRQHSQQATRRLAVDGSGTVHVAWVSDGLYNNRYERFTPELLPASRVVEINPPGTNPHVPVVAATPAGTTLIGYQNEGPQYVEVSLLDQDLRFHPGMRGHLRSEGVILALEPGRDSGARIHVFSNVWSNRSGLYHTGLATDGSVPVPSHLVTSRFLTASAFTTPLPRASMAPDGSIALLQPDALAGPRGLWLLVLGADGDLLHDPVLVAGPATDDGDVAVAPDGTIHVVWGTADGELLHRSIPGDTLALGQPVSVPEAGPDARVPRLAIDDTGHLHLTWLAGPVDRPDLRYAAGTPSGIGTLFPPQSAPVWDPLRPGTVREVPLQMVNYGDAPVSLTIDVSVSPIGMGSGWNATVPVAPSALGPGERGTVTIRLAAPGAGSGFDGDAAILRAVVTAVDPAGDRSTSTATSMAHLQVLRAPTVLPPEDPVIIGNGPAVVRFRAVNQGDVPEQVLVTFESAPEDWRTDVGSIDLGTLAPGEERLVPVRWTAGSGVRPGMRGSLAAILSAPGLAPQRAETPGAIGPVPWWGWNATAVDLRDVPAGTGIRLPLQIMNRGDLAGTPSPCLALDDGDSAWQVTLGPVPPIIAPGGSSGMILAAAPPAGTLAGTGWNGTLTANCGDPEPADRPLPVRLVAGGSPSLHASLDTGIAFAGPGDIAVVPLSLENRGTAAGSPDLFPVEHPAGWEVRILSGDRTVRRPILPPGTHEDFEIEVAVPGTADPGEGRVVVRFDDGSGTTSLLPFTVRVAEHLRILIESAAPRAATEAGVPARYPILVRNAGNVQQTLDVRADPDTLPPGWTIAFDPPGAVVVPPRGTAPVNVTVVPDRASGPGTYTVRIGAGTGSRRTGSGGLDLLLDLSSCNLRIVDLRLLPGAATVGTRSRVEVTVVNTGTVAAAGATLRLVVAGRQIGSDRNISLGSGARETIAMDWTPSRPGTVDVVATVDPDGLIGEISEADNARRIPVTVRASTILPYLPTVVLITVIAVVVAVVQFLGRRGGRPGRGDGRAGRSGRQRQASRRDPVRPVRRIS